MRGRDKVILLNHSHTATMSQCEVWHPCMPMRSSYTTTLAATGGLPPYVWSLQAGELPPGVTLSPATGGISGEPVDTGLFTFTVQVADANSQLDTKELTMRVAAEGLAVLFCVPSSGTRGASLTVKVLGTAFLSGANADFGDGIQVGSTTFVSTARLDVQISITAGAAEGGRTVTVTNPDTSVAAKSDCFTVAEPIFVDGFESGNTSAWSRAVGGGP